MTLRARTGVRVKPLVTRRRIAVSWWMRGELVAGVGVAGRYVHVYADWRERTVVTTSPLAAHGIVPGARSW